MTTVVDLFPDPAVLLALSPEELAEAILPLAAGVQQNNMVHFGFVEAPINGGPNGAPGYPQQVRVSVSKALAEAWAWLQTNGLLIHEPGQSSTWMFLSRRAEQILIEGSFRAYARTVALPKVLLHPSIAEEVWIDLVRGDHETAVFKAFRAVEIAVRDAGGYLPTDIGTALMRKAFDKAIGPLTDQTQPEAEREALAHLFTGAIGSYKNPHSHRTITVSDPSEALEMVLLASHLLRIVDSRR